jgi:hypothetical protein
MEKTWEVDAGRACLTSRLGQILTISGPKRLNAVSTKLNVAISNLIPGERVFDNIRRKHGKWHSVFIRVPSIYGERRVGR